MMLKLAKVLGRSIPARFRVSRSEVATERESHSALISKYLDSLALPHDGQWPVFVEVGAGQTTLTIAKRARELGGIFYSCDANVEIINSVRSKAGSDSEINFLIGDSLDSFKVIASKHDHISFLFLDGAASALHTFREFILLEPHLYNGSTLVIDNACLSETNEVFSPCRKGKILVPYLLSSPYWELFGHPYSGDSMVAAIKRPDPIWSDPSYEDPGYVDNWRQRAARLK